MRVGWAAEPVSGSQTTARGERDTSRGHSGWRSRGGSPGPKKDELIARWGRAETWHPAYTMRTGGPDSPKSRLKCNLADRGISQGPESPYSSRVETKRPRDDGDKDDNTRVSRRLSPPPEQRRTPLHLVKRPLKIRRLYCTVQLIRRTHHLDREALGYMLL